MKKNSTWKCLNPGVAEGIIVGGNIKALISVGGGDEVEDWL